MCKCSSFKEFIITMFFDIFVRHLVHIFRNNVCIYHLSQILGFSCRFHYKYNLVQLFLQRNAFYTDWTYDFQTSQEPANKRDTVRA